MPWTAEDVPDLDGRIVVVTGANSGLGLETVKAVAARRATVILACRDPARAEAARRAVAPAATGPAPETVRLDLADLGSVRDAADEVKGRFERLDVLVNNAGIMAVPPMRTADDFELQFGTNHLGHFALTGLLLARIRAGVSPRVVTLTSLAAYMAGPDLNDLQSERGYDPWRVYGRSKRANVLFMQELQRRSDAAGAGIVSVAAHPGYAATGLVANGPGRFSGAFGKAIYRAVDVIAPSAASGALPQIYAATSADVAGGRCYGPGGPFAVGGPLRLGASPRRVRTPGGPDRGGVGARLWEASEALTGVTFDWA